MKTWMVDDPEGLAPLLDGWDELAIEARRPFCAPGWLLAWWRHGAPSRAELRIVAVADGAELVGLAPYFVERKRGRVDYRLLGSGTFHRIEPLARPGLEAEVAAATQKLLHGCEPRPDLITLEGLDAASPWYDLGGVRYTTSEHHAPTVGLNGRDYESWLASRSKNARKGIRRARNRLDDLGAAIRLVGSPEEARRAGEALLGFHRRRFARRGGTNLPSWTPDLLFDAATALGVPERLRVLTIEANGEIIAVEVLVAAGGEVASWNGGFDERWASYSPSNAALTAAIEDCCSRGELRVDLGAGASHYKTRLADGDAPLRWGGVVTRGPRMPLAYLSLLPTIARASVKRRVLSFPPAVERIVRGIRSFRFRVAAVGLGAALIFMLE